MDNSWRYTDERLRFPDGKLPIDRECNYCHAAPGEKCFDTGYKGVKLDRSGPHIVRFDKNCVRILLQMGDVAFSGTKRSFSPWTTFSRRFWGRAK